MSLQELTQSTVKSNGYEYIFISQVKVRFLRMWDNFDLTRREPAGNASISVCFPPNASISNARGKALALLSRRWRDWRLSSPILESGQDASVHIDDLAGDEI